MKKQVGRWHLIVITACLVWPCQSSVLAAGSFDFNDGSTQGWTLDQMYVNSSQVKFTPVMGYTLLNSSNQLSAYASSLLIGKSDQNDIYLESPDLSANSNWQGITGYSVDVKRSLYSPCWGDFANLFYFQLQIKVIDSADGNKEKLFAEYDGANFVFHDITIQDHVYQFTWKPSWLTDPRYKVKKIRLRITGPGDVMAECWYRGSWNIDNVTATMGGATNNTTTGTNVQISLNSGVTVTFDDVSVAGNTTMTTSSSGTPPPGGFTVVPSSSPVYYSISTTATYSGSIKICIQYDDAGMTSQQESALKLQVYETTPGQWKNITTSLNTNTNTICGAVTHFSEFAVMFPSGGTTEEWVLTNEPIHGTVNCFTVSGINLLAGTEGGGVFLSTNNGVTWNPVNTGLTNTTVRALCTSGTQIFAGTWGGGIFLSTNNGANWTAVNTGLSDMSVSSLYGKEANLLAGTWGGGVFLSVNNASSWTAINTGITETHIRSLYICGSNFYAGTIGGLFYSANNGGNWTEINTGLTNTAAISLTGIPGNGGETLFVGTDGGGVFSSTNYGAVWTPVNTGLANLHVPFLCVGGTHLFAATWGGGVFMTANNGATWTEANEGLTDSYIRSLVVSGPDVFAGTNDGGIWRKQLPPMQFLAVDGWKDDFYKTLTGPNDGYLQIRSYAHNDNGKPVDDADLSAKIWTAWDEERFYLYEEVMDDTLSGDAAAVWEEDCIELKFDPQITDSVTNSVWDTRLTALDMGSPGVVQADNLNMLPDHLKQWARRQIPGGYALELAVSWSAIQNGSETITPAVGNIFGMAINQNDNDGKARRQATVQWAAVLKDAVWNTPKYHGTVSFLPGNKLEFMPRNSITGAVNPIPYDGSDYTPSGMKENPVTPLDYMLGQNYPNPFNPASTIPFTVKQPCRVTLKVYDIRGKEAAVLADERYEPGRHEVRFDASCLPSGLYLYRIEMGGFTATRKMAVMK